MARIPFICIYIRGGSGTLWISIVWDVVPQKSYDSRESLKIETA